MLLPGLQFHKRSLWFGAVSHGHSVREESPARIAQIPGPVACDYKIVCRLAGKPFVYDDFRAEMLVATGASHGLDEQGLMRAHGLTYVHNDPRGGIDALFRAIFGALPEM